MSDRTLARLALLLAFLALCAVALHAWYGDETEPRWWEQAIEEGRLC